jgi:hypothetical protein
MGYAVDGAEAVKILSETSAEAAAWWRDNAPHVLARGYRLIFEAEVCKQTPFEGAAEQSPTDDRS